MQSVKQKNSILLTFLLITITLLIAVSTYYYLEKNRAKPFYITNNELREVFY